MCNIVDIRKQSNYEIAVRISTDVDNQGREFYTDLNGFQVCLFIVKYFWAPSRQNHDTRKSDHTLYGHFS